VTDRFHGKHLAVVVDNADPKNLSRVRVQVPELFGQETTGWCLPCSPYAGNGVGLAAVPPAGSVVYVEWPGGDVTRTPIWSGGMWTDGNAVQGASPETLLLVTPSGHKIMLNDKGGDEAIEILAQSNAKITLDANGIKLEFSGKTVELKSDSVDINGGALKVT
jgi:uncharacterized protein involved in type VI secretion and phage assembly